MHKGMPSTVNELAAELYEVDATMADAQGYNYKTWEKANSSVRTHFTQKAQGAVNSGEFVLGKGWQNEG